MKGIFLLIAIFSLSITIVSGQGKYFTKSGKIDFFSTTPVEDIKALNKSVSAVLDVNTGNIQFSILMKGFQFKKGLMQEHFNDSYVESDKFPNSEFKGQIINNNEINYSKNGNNTAKVKGMLTIHGVTNEIETSAFALLRSLLVRLYSCSPSHTPTPKTGSIVSNIIFRFFFLKIIKRIN